MAKYMTRQRRALQEFLARHPDEALSVREMATAFAGEEISLSAVYRNLAQMEREGVVRRVSRPGSREAFYQYMEAEHCRDCLHLSCKKCGKTYHMHDHEAEALIRALTASEHFALDKSETVLYGVCGECQQGGAKGAGA